MLPLSSNPRYGYFPSTEKSFYVCKGEDEPLARTVFEAEGIADLNYVLGKRYLGRFLGSAATRSEWMKSKVDAWTAAVETLAKIAVNFPQAAYIGFVLCLQNEWVYVLRGTSDIAAFFEPLEKATHLKFYLGSLWDGLRGSNTQILGATGTVYQLRRNWSSQSHAHCSGVSRYLPICMQCPH